MIHNSAAVGHQNKKNSFMGAAKGTDDLGRSDGWNGPDVLTITKNQRTMEADFQCAESKQHST